MPILTRSLVHFTLRYLSPRTLSFPLTLVCLQVKEIEKRDSVLTPKQQIERLLRPGATYRNLNPFDVLQVEPDTSLEEIKKKYRRLSILGNLELISNLVATIKYYFFSASWQKPGWSRKSPAGFWGCEQSLENTRKWRDKKKVHGHYWRGGGAHRHYGITGLLFIPSLI